MIFFSQWNVSLHRIVVEGNLTLCVFRNQWVIPDGKTSQVIYYRNITLWQPAGRRKIWVSTIVLSNKSFFDRPKGGENFGDKCTWRRGWGVPSPIANESVTELRGVGGSQQNRRKIKYVFWKRSLKRGILNSGPILILAQNPKIFSRLRRVQKTRKIDHSRRIWAPQAKIFGPTGVHDDFSSRFWLSNVQIRGEKTTNRQNFPPPAGMLK